jgi:hypothetical protein
MHRSTPRTTPPWLIAIALAISIPATLVATACEPSRPTA